MLRYSRSVDKKENKNPLQILIAVKYQQLSYKWCRKLQVYCVLNYRNICTETCCCLFLIQQNERDEDIVFWQMKFTAIFISTSTISKQIWLIFLEENSNNMKNVRVCFFFQNITCPLTSCVGRWWWCRRRFPLIKQIFRHLCFSATFKIKFSIDLLLKDIE